MGNHWLKVVLLTAVGGCSAPTSQEPSEPRSGEVAPILTEPSDWEAIGLARERKISPLEARQRLHWQALGLALQDRAAAELGEDFAGVWIEPNDGDRVKVGVTRAAAAPAALRIARAVGLNEGVDQIQVRYSLTELAEAKSWIATELHRVNKGAAKTLKVSVRTDDNVVALALPTDATLTPAQRELVDTAQTRFGDRVALHTFSGNVTSTACVYPNCDPPLRGGVRIETPLLGGTNVERCTGAFIARSKVDSKLYQFTAGHCFVTLPPIFGDTVGFRSDGSTLTIGPVHHAIWGSDGDAAIVEISSPDSWHPQNRILVTAGPGFDGVNGTNADSNYDITATGWSIIGQRICISGERFGSSNCGRVTDLDVSYTGTNGSFEVDVDNAGEASFCAKRGDSGAPIFASHTAFGINNAAADECDILYTGIRGAEARLNVTVLTEHN